MKSMNLPHISGTCAVPQKIVESSTSSRSIHMTIRASSVATSTTPVPKLRDLRAGDAKEADDDIVWAAYKRIEPRYSRTNRMLANM
jgi:hypothetical protein